MFSLLGVVVEAVDPVVPGAVLVDTLISPTTFCLLVL
jgi:hypothetical protein